MNSTRRYMTALMTARPSTMTQPMRIPEAPAEPITQARNIWALGEHRQICVNVTDPEWVARLMAGAGGAPLHLAYQCPARDYGARDGEGRRLDALMQGVFVAARHRRLPVMVKPRPRPSGR